MCKENNVNTYVILELKALRLIDAAQSIVSTVSGENIAVAHYSSLSNTWYKALQPVW